MLCKPLKSHDDSLSWLLTTVVPYQLSSVANGTAGNALIEGKADTLDRIRGLWERTWMQGLATGVDRVFWLHPTVSAFPANPASSTFLSYESITELNCLIKVLEILLYTAEVYLDPHLSSQDVTGRAHTWVHQRLSWNCHHLRTLILRPLRSHLWNFLLTNFPFLDIKYKRPQRLLRSCFWLLHRFQGKF